jgi:hypothetical protein
MLRIVRLVVPLREESWATGIMFFSEPGPRQPVAPNLSNSPALCTSMSGSGEVKATFARNGWRAEKPLCQPTPQRLPLGSRKYVPQRCRTSRSNRALCSMNAY